MNTLASGDAWVAGNQSGESNIAERFEALWSVSGRLVNEPNSRRQGTSETIRLALKKAEYGLQPGNYFIKRQQAYYYRAFSTLGTRHPTCSREFDALRQFKSLGLDVPEVAYFHHERDSKRAILITRELVGYRDLKSELAQPPSTHWRTKLVRCLSQAFRGLHSTRYRHGALYPDHVFVAGDSVAFIDLEKARVTLSRRANALTDISRFLRYVRGLLPQEIAIIL